MAFHDLTTFALLKKRETTWGEVEASGGPRLLTLVTEGLKGKPEMAQSKSSRSDRRSGPSKRVKLSGEGPIVVELLPGAAQTTEFLEEAHSQAFTRTNLTATDISFASGDNSINSAAAAFGSFVAGSWITIRGAGTAGNNTDGVSPRNWAAYVVSATASKIVLAYITVTTETAGATVKLDGYYARDGQTVISSSYERRMGAAGSYEFQPYLGQVVNSVAIDYPANAIPTMTVNTTGLGPGAKSATSIFDGEAITAGPIPTEGTVADTSNNLKLFRLNGALSSIMKMFKIDAAQNNAYVNVSQQLGPLGISLGTHKVSGSFTGILQPSDAVSLLAYNRTAHAIHFAIDCPDATEVIYTSIFSLTFDEMGDVAKTADTGPAEYTFAWTAQVDPTIGCYWQTSRIPKTV
jgi:hypothetical protein